MADRSPAVEEEAVELSEEDEPDPPKEEGRGVTTG